MGSKRVRSPAAPLSSARQTMRTEQVLPPHLSERAGLQRMAGQAQALGCISFVLPTVVNPTAGAVLHHCTTVVQNILEKHYPLIFKLGFTHDAVWRWSNDIYGYAVSKDKWTHMIILHVASEPFSVAMLEAALIDKFGGTSTSCIKLVSKPVMA